MRDYERWSYVEHFDIRFWKFGPPHSPEAISGATECELKWDSPNVFELMNIEWTNGLWTLCHPSWYGPRASWPMDLIPIPSDSQHTPLLNKVHNTMGFSIQAHVELLYTHRLSALHTPASLLFFPFFFYSFSLV